MEQAMESPHALDGCNCRALVGKARFSYFTDVCHTYRCNEPKVETDTHTEKRNENAGPADADMR